MKTYTEKAINKAIEGGWDPESIHVSYTSEIKFWLPEGGCYFAPTASIFLDPKWWQALGKAEGWEDNIEEGNNPEWSARWHSFIDHLIAGKDPDSFFESLLK